MATPRPSARRGAVGTATAAGRLDSLVPGDGRVELGLVTIAAAATAVYLLIGPGLLMDDWWSLRNVLFDGPLAAAGDDQWRARPATGVIYTVVFGGIGAHPAVGVVLLGALQATSAVLFHRLLRAFFSPFLAAVAPLVWLLLPNHTSLEVWMSTTNIAVAQVLLLAGGVVLARCRLTAWTGLAAGVCFLVATLAYEASAPIAIAMGVVLPVLRRRPVPVVPALAATALPVAGAVWAWVHVNPAKRVSTELIDISPVLPANLGWGVAGFVPGVEIVYAIGLGIVVVSAARLAAPIWRARAGEAEWAAVVGVGVMVLGALPFIRYAFEPLGGGDRENFIAAFGGALVWAAGITLLARRSRSGALAAGVCLVLVVLPVRWHRWQLWHTASRDAAALTAAAAERALAAGGRVTIGPGPIIVENTTAFDGRVNLEGGVQFAARDRSVQVRLVGTDAELQDAPAAERVDMRAVGALDDRAGP